MKKIIILFFVTFSFILKAEENPKDKKAKGKKEPEVMDADFEDVTDKKTDKKKDDNDKKEKSA